MDEKNKKLLAELIEQLAGGDISALNEIAGLVGKSLMTIANYYYKNRADMEDAVANLYLKLCNKAFCFRKKSNAYGWLLKVFENSIKSHLRLQKREEKYLQKEIAHFQSDTNIVDDRYADNHLFLREVLDKLTAEERKIVMYYYWCKCTIKEVAEIIHKPKSTVAYKLKVIEEKIKNS